jgi:hypothetical protein
MQGRFLKLTPPISVQYPPVEGTDLREVPRTLQVCGTSRYQGGQLTAVNYEEPRRFCGHRIMVW